MDNPAYLVFAAIVSMICMMIGTLGGEAKGRGGAGALLGLLLGPLGLVILLLLPNRIEAQAEKAARDAAALEQIQIQKSKLAALEQLRTAAAREEPKLRVASAGEDLGAAYPHGQIAPQNRETHARGFLLQPRGERLAAARRLRGTQLTRTP